MFTNNSHKFLLFVIMKSTFNTKIKFCFGSHKCKKQLASLGNQEENLTCLLHFQLPQASGYSKC